MKKQNILKIQVCCILLFLVPSLLLVSPEVEGARKFFIALTWVLSVFALNAYFFPNRKGWRDTLRIIAISALTPLAVTFALAGGDAVMAYFSSSAANDSAQVMQMSWREIIKIVPTALRMWHLGDLRQLNGNFNWFYFVISGAVLLAFVKLVLSWLNLLYKKAREKKLHNQVVSS